MKIETGDLYKAAFLLSWGGNIDETAGTYPHTTFTIYIPKLKYYFADRFPFVSWKIYRKKREVLKEASKQCLFHKTKLGDVARVSVWKR